MSGWQRIGEVPVDSGRLVLVDPMNTDDVAEHEGDSALSYELVSNDLGIAVALISRRAWATGPMGSRRVSRRRPSLFGSPRSGSCLIR